jgi:general secretion pathway protein K
VSGVAVVTALLLTTLAVTIVASLFWQQQVQVRSMENQRLQLQTRWIVRGALDLSRLVLYQDFLDSSSVTRLNGVWATPLEETRLDDYIERERAQAKHFNATLAGRMMDAQSRYNLANLVKAGQRPICSRWRHSSACSSMCSLIPRWRRRWLRRW